MTALTCVYAICKPVRLAGCNYKSCGYSWQPIDTNVCFADYCCKLPTPACNKKTCYYDMMPLPIFSASGKPSPPKDAWSKRCSPLAMQHLFFPTSKNSLRRSPSVPDLTYRHAFGNFSH